MILQNFTINDIIKITLKSNEKGVIYMKNKLIKCLIIIFIIIIIIFLANLIRKIYLIEKYDDENDKYQASTNFYQRYTEEDRITEIWRKGDVALLKMKGKDVENILYWSNEQSWIISNSLNGVTKTAVKYDEMAIQIPTISNSYFNTEGLMDSIKLAFKSKITTENIENEECYKFTLDDTEEYVNVSNFKLLKIKDGNMVRDKIYYELDTVEDSEIEFPNLEGYKIIDK